LVAQGPTLELGGSGQQRVQFGAAPVLGVEEMLHRRDPGGEAGEKRKSPARGWAFRTDERLRPAYPAAMWASGRRAREVMPAAMRAEVRTAAARSGDMGGQYAGRARGRQAPGQSAAPSRSGVTGTRTRRRLPGS